MTGLVDNRPTGKLAMSGSFAGVLGGKGLSACSTTRPSGESSGRAPNTQKRRPPCASPRQA